MSWLRKPLCAPALSAVLASLALLAQPAPPEARANIVCAAGGGAITGGIGAITGAIGGGNPVGDACNAVTDAVSGVIPNPVTGAVKGIGGGIFDQITSWVADGAGWLIGKVVTAIEETTTPQLTTSGFVAQYGKMAAIAALLGLTMLLLAVLEGVAQGNATLLVRVALVNLPLAFLATSVAYIVVQLLLVATDGLCHAITSVSDQSGQRFFEGAIKGLGEAGGNAGGELGGVGGNEAGAVIGEATGSVAVPVFVTFLAAIIGAFAAFLVWLELLMRDAAVYVVALFMPLALAASIWPRWSGALRRSIELLLVVIGSKFVIVAIISLAASLISANEGRVEHILAASALMLLACFAPFVLLKLVPFAEGAMGAAYGRRSAAGGATSGVQVASGVQMVRNMAQSNWGGSGATLWGAEEKGAGGRPGPEPSGGRGSEGGKQKGGGGGGGAGGGAAEGGGGAVAASGGAASAAAVPAAAVRGAQSAARRLQQSGVAQQASDPSGAPGQGSDSYTSAGDGGRSAEGAGAPGVGDRPPRPAPERPAAKFEGEGQG